jgi:hypothetical protein
VTAQLAVNPPSAVVTVIVVVPTVIGITIPVLPTVATEVLLLVQLTFVLVALAGVIVAVRKVLEEPPVVRLRVVGLMLTPVTDIGAETVI